MSIGVRRLVAALVAVFAAVLTGCTASGVVEVRSADEVMIDVTITHAMDEYVCDKSGFRPDAPLTATAGKDDSQQPTCHIVGTLHPDLLRDYLTVSHAGEFLVASFNPLGVVPGADESRAAMLSQFTGLDLVVRFPGQVQSATGEWDGNAAHFRDPEQFIRPYGLRAEALDHPGPAWSVIGPIAGFLAGAAVAVLGFALWRRRGGRGSVDDPEDLVVESDADAGEGGEDEAPGANEAPVGSTPSDEPSIPPVPEQDTADAPRRRPDDSVWAPPDD